jgi:hypothetical protein
VLSHFEPLRGTIKRRRRGLKIMRVMEREDLLSRQFRSILRVACGILE